MAKFMITYLAGDQPDTAEQGQQHFAKYQAWLKSHASAMISPANPLKNTCLIQADGSVSQQSETGMSGFTLIEADSIEIALEIAQACPFLEINGRLEVSQIIDMNF